MYTRAPCLVNVNFLETDIMFNSTSKTSPKPALLCATAHDLGLNVACANNGSAPNLPNNSISNNDNLKVPIP